MKLTSKASKPVETAIDGQNTVIKSNDKYLWRDEKAYFVLKTTTGGNNPVLEEYLPGFEGLVFDGSIMNQVWVDFHMNHNLALNTKIYPHVHWMPLVAGSGTVRWGFQYVIAKGHGQSAFPTVSTTVYVDHVITPSDVNKHLVTEFPDDKAILSSEIEPDTVIKIRIFRDAAVDTYNGKVHAWQSDIHYQIERIGTINKAPNFYND